VFKTVSDFLYLLIYVNDIIITGSSSVLIPKLITKLHAVFALKQLGNLDYFLGIEVKHLSNGSLLLSQAKYICDLLEKAKMVDAKPILTPLPRLFQSLLLMLLSIGQLLGHFSTSL